MNREINRRKFLQISAAGGAICLGGTDIFSYNANQIKRRIIKSKVKVARIYLGTSFGLWPKPDLNFDEEIRKYKTEFEKFKSEFLDVEFIVDKLITSNEELNSVIDRLKEVDGILAIQFNIGIMPVLKKILEMGKPTMVFAVPYSGHEWIRFGTMQKQKIGARMECMLTSDYSQLVTAIKPFRAIHHLGEAKILNLTTQQSDEYVSKIKNRFGTEIKMIKLKRVIDTYNSIDDKKAKKETEKWIKNAEKVVEPSEEEIFRSCKLALAFEKLLDEENATVMTVDCYGTMWDKTIKLPAYPCIGFTRLNDMGLGGICESDLRAAMTYIILQGLTGRPGFISDPTVDESSNTIILAHCLGTTKMDGPDKPSAPYKLRSIMERREGAVPQVKMRVGQRVTQAILIDSDNLRYFTGEIIDTPVSIKYDRGCRTKIVVKVDGSVENLWRNWTDGLHRLTCYGDIARELKYFCKFKNIKII